MPYNCRPIADVCQKRVLAGGRWVVESDAGLEHYAYCPCWRIYDLRRGKLSRPACKFSFMSTARSNALSLHVVKVATLSKPRWAALRFTHKPPHGPDSSRFVGKERSFFYYFFSFTYSFSNVHYKLLLNDSSFGEFDCLWIKEKRRGKKKSEQFAFQLFMLNARQKSL